MQCRTSDFVHNTKQSNRNPLFAFAAATFETTYCNFAMTEKKRIEDIMEGMDYFMVFSTFLPFLRYSHFTPLCHINSFTNF